jgi:fatty acyl-CoA reductase
MVKMQNKIAQTLRMIEYFNLRQWNFQSENVRILLEEMSQNDKLNFQFDLRMIVWKDFVEKYTLGIRRFLFKQDPSTIESSRKKMKK